MIANFNADVRIWKLVRHHPTASLHPCFIPSRPCRTNTRLFRSDACECVRQDTFRYSRPLASHDLK